MSQLNLNNIELLLANPQSFVWQSAPYEASNQIAYSLAMKYLGTIHLIPLRMASEPAPFSYTSGHTYHFDKASLYSRRTSFRLQLQTFGAGTGIEGDVLKSSWYGAEVDDETGVFSWRKFPDRTKPYRSFRLVSEITSDDTGRVLADGVAVCESKILI